MDRGNVMAEGTFDGKGAGTYNLDAVADIVTLVSAFPIVRRSKKNQ